MSACVMARPNAAATVSPNEVRPPTSATLSAGMMSSVIVSGSTDFWFPATRMPRSARDHRRQHPVGAGEEVGREPEQHRALLVLRGGARRDAEPGEAEERPQRDGEGDHDRDHEQLLGVHADRERQLHLRGRAVAEERRAGGRAEAAHDDRLEEQQHPDRRDDLGERRRGAQRPEHQEVQREAHEHAEHQRHGERGREGERRAEGDLGRTARQVEVGTAAEEVHRRLRRAASGFGSGGRNRLPSVRSSV